MTTVDSTNTPQKRPADDPTGNTADQSAEGKSIAAAPTLELPGTPARSRLWLQILIAMVLGVGIGLVFSPKGLGIVSVVTGEEIAGWLALPGHLFLALIRMMVIPLVIASIINGITAGSDVGFLQRIGVRLLPYFVFTTIAAVSIGIAVSTVLEPGRFIPRELVSDLSAGAEVAPEIVQTPEQQTIPHQIINLIPSNPLAAAIDESMLQIVVFAILMGVAMLLIPAKRSRALISLTQSIQEVSMQVVGWAMRIAPLAVFGLLAQITIQVGFTAIVSMSAYVLTVLLGLMLLLGLYLFLIWIVGRRSPFDFLRKVRNVLLLAFSTSSSAAVLPVSMQAARRDLNVSEEVSQVVLPVGATINMDGTALYQVAAAIFLAQVFGLELTGTALILLTVTTVGASIGAPSTPGVGIVILATILDGIGIPAAGIALILGVDRILDMSRTAVNVAGDLTACVVMDRLVGGGDASTGSVGGAGIEASSSVGET